MELIPYGSDWRTFPKQYLRARDYPNGILKIEHHSYENKGKVAWVEHLKRFGIILEDIIYRNRRKIYYKEDDPLYVPPSKTNPADQGNYFYYEIEESFGHFALIGKMIIFIFGEKEE